MIQSMAHVLDMLGEIKKYLYDVSKNGPAKQAPEIRTPPNLRFQTSSDAYSAGILYEKQSLMLAKYHGHWVVDRVHRHCYSECILTPCKREDLKMGDVAYMSSDDEPDFTGLDDYYIMLDDDKAVCWCDRGETHIIIDKFVYNYRVEVA